MPGPASQEVWTGQVRFDFDSKCSGGGNPLHELGAPLVGECACDEGGIGREYLVDGVGAHEFERAFVISAEEPSEQRVAALFGVLGAGLRVQPDDGAVPRHGLV